MRRLIGLIFAVGLGAVAMFLAFSVHIVRTESDWHFVKKQKTEFADCFADVREWDAREWGQHPQLKKALVQAGKGEIIKEDPQEFLFNVFDPWQNARRDQPTNRQ